MSDFYNTWGNTWVMCLPWRWILLISTAVATAVVLVDLYQRRRKQAAEGENPENTATPAADAGEKSPDSRPEKTEDGSPGGDDASGVFPETMAQVVAAITNEDLAGLLQSRMEDLEYEETEVAKAGALVSILDEIHIMESGINEKDQGSLQRAVEAILQELGRMGARVLDLDEWDPQWQRAVEVRRDLPPGAAPVIAEKVESGLVLRDRLCRKQAVILRKAAE